MFVSKYHFYMSKLEHPTILDAFGFFFSRFSLASDQDLWRLRHETEYLNPYH